MSEQAAVARVTSNVASRGTLLKLIVFSLSLGIVPLASYYGSLKYFWNGNTTFAAITAVFAANLVLIIYIVTSLLEDKQSPSQSQETSEKKKDR
ncbi:hypothetical protein Moror_17537 [Moniliophthora roreri MCA 2997]|uniref:Vacuolar ATPase assembly integral membrane protein VMA21 n=2 Tax=Moniliophthora roreri TaxID=221103 RepID=V2XUT0_MONRO|nr:hypothetical protein Moror_17537 [Moniliophthora roreri MCA 2997]KAI3612399.1 hypothetical protein WG66_009928 [Moniliophthora roreri]